MSDLRNATQLERRLFLLKAVVLFSVLCVEGRLVYLQVFKHWEFQDLAKHQQYQSREASASRGVIEDRAGSLLAMNIGLFNVSAHPNQIADKASTALALSRALKEPYAEILNKISGDKPFVWVARQVPYDRSQDVEALRLEGVEASREQRRLYPDQKMAAQVLGFTGLDNQGLDGLEKRYDRYLSGRKGQVETERDARGRVVLTANKKGDVVQDGLGVVTTLDETIQHIAQVELQKAFDKYRCKAASIAVMDPHTGEILAMANYPTFDPNDFKAAPAESWKNRMVNSEFEPGSTFKLIAAAGALEEGVVNEDDKFFCENGSYHTDYGRVVSDHEKYGWLTFREVFGYSSNIGMVKVGAKLGAANLYRYAKRFGIGDLTGIDLPGEAAGKLRPLEKWSGLSMTSIPYGYEVSTTPMQMLTAYGAVANGGVMMKPYLVKALINSNGRVVKSFGPEKIRRACSAKTARRLTEMLKWVVEKGTGTAVAIPSYDIAGKTGTAYKFMNGHYSKYSYESSFIGFVPADNPKFVIYVSLDDPRGIYWGGYTAGPVFKEVAKRALVYDLVPGKEPSEANPVLASNMPSFMGLTKDQSKWLAQASGLKAKFTGKGERVASQSQPAGSSIQGDDPKARKILLTLGDSPEPTQQAVMPDLRGKTKRQALALLAPLGVKVNMRGEGIVHSQFPSAGRSLQSDTLCEISCDIPVAKSMGGTGTGGNS